VKLRVELEQCTRCGACAALCPGVFVIDEAGSRAAREPTNGEKASVLAARLICPTDAIRMSADESADPSSHSDAPLFDELAVGAEHIRWRLDAIPWSEVDGARAPADLRAVVREMAFAENATYTATQRFLEAFFDDIDFTRWISVWFYEETRHPHVLGEWLRRVGEPIAVDVVLKGRVSTPFMKSVVGTLVTNVISEITAAQAYRALARRSPEPVLAGIARRIAGDEARHASSFFRFARQRLAHLTPDAARRERTRGVEVLQAWLGGTAPATHPVAQMMERLSEGPDTYDVGFGAVRTRVIRVVGLLLDLPMRRDDDVPLVLRDLLSQRGGRHDGQ
jgi:ferredoxin/rubrerythrin